MQREVFFSFCADRGLQQSSPSANPKADAKSPENSNWLCFANCSEEPLLSSDCLAPVGYINDWRDILIMIMTMLILMLMLRISRAQRTTVGWIRYDSCYSGAMKRSTFQIVNGLRFSWVWNNRIKPKKRNSSMARIVPSTDDDRRVNREQCSSSRFNRS